MYDAVPARLATIVARQRSLSAMWDGDCSGGGGFHIARQPVGAPVPADQEADLPELVGGWDGNCERCGLAIPWEQGVRPSGAVLTVYDTPSGKLEPGCLYWADWLDQEGRCFYGWTNCDGRHLHGVLPNGHYWDIDARAANCGSPTDSTHRCWVRHGEPPTVHVDKYGHTCTAGAGSIIGGDYHGFLHQGVFTAG